MVKTDKNYMTRQAEHWIGIPEDECESGLTDAMTTNSKVKKYAVRVLTNAITSGSIDLGLACVKAKLLDITDRFPVFRQDLTNSQPHE